MEARAHEFTTAVRTLERFVARNGDGTLTLTASSTQAGVGSAYYAEVATGMDEVNKLVRQGALTTAADLSVYQTATSSFAPQSTYSAWYWHWWGVEVHLSAYWTNKLIAAGNVAAAAAVLCGATGVCAAPAAIVSAILWLGASVIQWCSNSRGVVLVKSYAGPMWCHGH